MSKISLANRKRIGELTIEPTQADIKKEELLWFFLRFKKCS